MNVLFSLLPVMRMHTATTQWAAMCVSAMMATLEMAHSAMVRTYGNYCYTFVISQCKLITH